MRIIIDTDAEYVPAFRVFAKALKAKMVVEKESPLMADLRESLREVRDIRDGKKKGLTLDEVIHGKK